MLVDTSVEAQDSRGKVGLRKMLGWKEMFRAPITLFSVLSQSYVFQTLTNSVDSSAMMSLDMERSVGQILTPRSKYPLLAGPTLSRDTHSYWPGEEPYAFI